MREIWSSGHRLNEIVLKKDLFDFCQKLAYRLWRHSFRRWLVYIGICKRMSMPKAVLLISPVDST